MHSFNETLDHYRALLVAQRKGRLHLPNDDLDTGIITGAATYGLTDETYARLLDKTNGRPISDALRRDFLSLITLIWTNRLQPSRTRRHGRSS